MTWSARAMGCRMITSYIAAERDDAVLKGLAHHLEHLVRELRYDAQREEGPELMRLIAPRGRRSTAGRPLRRCHPGQIPAGVLTGLAESRGRRIRVGHVDPHDSLRSLARKESVRVGTPAGTHPCQLPITPAPGLPMPRPE